MTRKFLLIFFIIPVLSGCALFKPDERKLIPDKIPSNYSMYSDEKASSNSLWWKDFNNKELNNFVKMAIDDNFDLRQAYARLKQSRALFAISRAAQLPEVSVTGGASHTKIDESPSTSNSFSTGLAASYELDLWGKIRSAKEADRLYMKQNQALYDSAAMTVVANVAELWADIISTQQEIIFVKESIKTNEELLAMMELRFEKSLATALDVLQQRESLASARSKLPTLEANEIVYLNNLSILTGETSGRTFNVKSEELPAIPSLPETGLPADLISMRPDIRAAGLNLKAADWEISVARASRLPAISLSASGVYSSTTVDDLFKNWAANLAANLTGPIFDAGKRKAEVSRVRAVAEERLAVYEETVFSAIRDVENALVDEDRQSAFIRALENELKASRSSKNETIRRYLAGQVDFISLQDRILRVQNLERLLIRQKAVLVKYRIALYRALGGNWSIVSDKNGKKITSLRQTVE